MKLNYINVWCDGALSLSARSLNFRVSERLSSYCCCYCCCYCGSCVDNLPPSLVEYRTVFVLELDACHPADLIWRRWGWPSRPSPTAKTADAVAFDADRRRSPMSSSARKVAIKPITHTHTHTHNGEVTKTFLELAQLTIRNDERESSIFISEMAS